MCRYVSCTTTSGTLLTCSPRIIFSSAYTRNHLRCNNMARRVLIYSHIFPQRYCQHQGRYHLRNKSEFIRYRPTSPWGLAHVFTSPSITVQQAQLIEIREQPQACIPRPNPIETSSHEQHRFPYVTTRANTLATSRRVRSP